MPPSAAVVGAGILGLSTARALAADGFSVTVHEQHTVGTPLGGSPGPSRLFRTSYPDPGYVRLAQMAVEEWHRLDDPRLLIPSGLLEVGPETRNNADALASCGEPFQWLEPGEATAWFPEARLAGLRIYHAWRPKPQVPFDMVRGRRPLHTRCCHSICLTQPGRWARDRQGPSRLQ